MRHRRWVVGRYDAGYTYVMKTAISLPDDLFREADRVAKRLKLSRNELFRRALTAFVASSRDAEITASYNAAFASAEAPDELKFRRAAVRRVLRDVEWKE